jgi:DNA mismatch repair ATPase MutS
VAQAIAALDVLCTLAERSLTLNWAEPQFVSQPCIEIEAAATPWWKRAWPRPPAAASSPTTRA